MRKEMRLLWTSGALALRQRQGVFLCLVLLVGFALYIGQRFTSTSAEFTPAQSYVLALGVGSNADHPCDHSAPEYDHKAHVGCASGNGCTVAVVVTQVATAAASLKLVIYPARTSSLTSLGAVPHFRPPRSSVRA